MDRFARFALAALAIFVLASCSSGGEQAETPEPAEDHAAPAATYLPVFCGSLVHRRCALTHRPCSMPQVPSRTTRSAALGAESAWNPVIQTP